MLIKALVFLVLLTVAGFVVYFLATFLPQRIRALISNIFPDSDLNIIKKKDDEILQLEMEVKRKDDLIKDLQMSIDNELPYQTLRKIEQHYTSEEQKKILKEFQ